MNPVRVLHHVWRLSPSGGIPVVVRDLARSLDPARIELHVCSSRPLLAQDRLDAMGPNVTLHTLGQDGPPGPLDRARLAAGLAGTVREVRPDVLHVHSGVAWHALGPLLRRVPTGARVLEVHDAPQTGRQGRASIVVERTIARRFGFIPLTHSRSVLGDVAAAYAVDPSGCICIPIGIDTASYRDARRHRAAVRAELRLDPDIPVVLWVGRLVPTKRPELFVEMAARIAGEVDASFVLVGRGGLANRLTALIAERGLTGRVQLAGYVEDLVALYGAADLFVNTATYEGFGIAVLEAMAAGLPVVATRGGGVEEVVGGQQTGFVVDGDADAVAATVRTLLTDTVTRSATGAAAARRAAAEFDIARTADRYAGFYEAITARGA